MRKSLSYILVILFCVTGVVLAEPLKADENTSVVRDHYTLKGSNELCVFIVYRNPQLEQSEYGRILKEIENTVEGELKGVGIEILPDKTSYLPCLFINIIVMDDEEEDSFAVSIDVDLKQLVYPKLNPDIICYATTWHSGRNKKVEGEGVKDYIDNTLLEAIDVFIDSYLATNPIKPSKQRIKPSISKLGDLIIEEYPLNIRKRSQPSRESNKQLGEKTLSKRAKWRDFDRESHFNKKRAFMNEKLAPFGYRLALTEVKEWQKHYHSDLYRDNKLLLQNITPRSVVVNESGTDFALFAANAPNAKPSGLTIQKNSIQPYIRSVVTPVFLGDDLVTVECEDPSLPASQPYTYKVKYKNEVLYTVSALEVTIHPIRSLYNNNGHWILEVDTQVIIDGKSLNKRLGYDKIFRYVFYKDKTLYFFEKNGKVGISYNGKVLPVTYEKVPHYPCCDNAGIDVNDNMLWFYGLRNDTWYYVEMGIYK